MIVELLNDIIVYSKMWLEFHTSSELDRESLTQKERLMARRSECAMRSNEYFPSDGL